MSRAPASEILKAAALYAALTLLFAYPLSFHPGTTIFGDNPDTHLFIWTLAWDAHAFVHNPLAIFDANIFFPNRLTLAYSENLIGSAFLSAPIQWITGNPVLAMNWAALLSCVLCGVGAHLLARSIGLNARAAIVCGLVFAFAPARFIRTGQLHLGAVEWLPFALASLHSYFANGDKRSLRLAAAFFTLQALATGHGAVFLTIAAGGLVAYRLAAGEPLALGRRVRDLGLVGAALLAPMVFVVWAYRDVQVEMGLRRSLQDWAPTAVSFLASPTHVQQWLLSWAPGLHVNENASAYLFPGVLPVVLAAVALASLDVTSSRRSWAWRADPTLFYFLLTLIAVLISIGPPLGIWPLIYWLPGFNFIRVPSRFMVLAMLGLAVLAAIGFARLAARVDNRKQTWLALAVGTLMVAEFAGMPLPVTQYRVDILAIDRWLATRPGPFAVAEFPSSAIVRTQTTYMLYSMAHWQKTVHGYSGIEPPLHARLYQELRGFPDEVSLQRLRELRVQYLVVHEDMYRPGEWQDVERRLRQFEDRLTLEHAEPAGRVYSLRGDGGR